MKPGTRHFVYGRLKRVDLYRTPGTKQIFETDS